MVATDFSREEGYTFAIPAGGDALKIYLDLVVILNFLVDFLLLLGTNRLSGFPASPLRAAASAALWADCCSAGSTGAGCAASSPLFCCMAV